MRTRTPTVTPSRLETRRPPAVALSPRPRRRRGRTGGRSASAILLGQRSCCRRWDIRLQLLARRRHQQPQPPRARRGQSIAPGLRTLLSCRPCLIFLFCPRHQQQASPPRPAPEPRPERSQLPLFRARPHCTPLLLSPQRSLYQQAPLVDGPHHRWHHLARPPPIRHHYHRHRPR
ncbi:hypothetical protein GE09DRAFT_1150078 [Coniochaeta sp. 2T2.1]|nr:hypothetical protein GE09DRAFT_1150078 [Coniochaeta sp. 2T2.1]